jgi:hypothetical protein
MMSLEGRFDSMRTSFTLSGIEFPSFCRYRFLNGRFRMTMNEIGELD